jgi:hypothetical protein
MIVVFPPDCKSMAEVSPIPEIACTIAFQDAPNHTEFRAGHRISFDVRECGP